MRKKPILKSSSSSTRDGDVGDAPDIELDGYESSSSSEDFEDDGNVGADYTDSKGGENPLERINIEPDQYSESYLPDVQMLDTEDPFKNTELVLKFNYKIGPEALRWFIKKVTAKKSQGGAELLLKREPYLGNKTEGLVVHVTAAGWRLLEVAEKLEIKKMDYIRNVPRHFKLREVTSFMNDSMEISDILTPAEKQIAVMHELRHLLVHPGERHIPGYRHIMLTKLISSYFALHQEEELNKLKGNWFWAFWEATPYEDIRSYFGDATSLYFNFIGYYSFYLTIPAIIGALLTVLPFVFQQVVFHNLVYCFCIMNMLFVTIFLIMWQRYQSRLTYRWGTLHVDHWEEPRENHEGVLALDPVTGQLQRRYPYYKSALKTYGVSGPIVFLCCTIAIWCMFLFLKWEYLARKYADTYLTGKSAHLETLFWKWGFPAIPSMIYAIAVFVLTRMYRYIANVLTEWENHRTETQFERHLVTKMVIFEVANSFAILLYTSFVKYDPEQLHNRVLTVVGVVQLMMTLSQLILPRIVREGQERMHAFLEDGNISSVFRGSGERRANLDFHQPYPGLEGVDIEMLDPLDKRVQMSKVEEMMAPYSYEDDFDEYLNLYLQFGYIFLFSSVIPLAAAFALGNNLVILSSGLYKRREVYQRPLARKVSSIGAWLQAFELMGVAAVITNCGLLALSKPLRESYGEFTDLQWALLFVFIEHAILVLQHFVKKICPKVPYNVKVALAQLEYRSRMALKREQLQKTRRRITQVFHPINSQLSDKPRDQNDKSTNSLESTAKSRVTYADDKPKSQPSRNNGPSTSQSAGTSNNAKKRQ